MSEFRLRGLIAAAVTPFDARGDVNPAPIPGLVDSLIADGVGGLFVCGTTGEGSSLTTGERRLVAEAYREACGDRIPVTVHVGHNSLREAQELADHASRLGAAAVSATCPSYFRPENVDRLTDCLAEIASAAENLPFYYYHIPALTGVDLDMLELLTIAGERIPNLAGIKYTKPTLWEFQSCLEHEAGRFDLLWGVDEMLLSALAVGARGAIGSTYNLFSPLYREILAAFEAGELEAARQLQSQSVARIRKLKRTPFLSAVKAELVSRGHDVGGCRLPL